jgi:site-specific recombinase XerD
MSRRLLPHEVHVPDWIRASELQAHADGFVRHLFDQGYRKSTILPYRAAVAHFAHWMTVRKIRVSELNEDVIGRFLTRHLPVCHCGALRQRWPHTVRAALRALLRFLRSQEVIGPACSTDPPAVVQELQAFAHYQEHVCGHTQATRAVSRLRVRAFLLGCFGCRDIRMDALSAKDVMRFINRYTANCTHRSRYTIGRSIRGYLRFKALTEPYAEVLCERLPKVAQWRLASLPKSLSAAESEAVLAAAKCYDATGRRDYAILRCLNDLGLRTVEVARLQLDDFDWQAGTVRIRGKGHRVDVMPLPASTGKAVVDYVRHGRPRNAGRALFYRHAPPHWAPATIFVVRAAVRTAAKQAGLTRQIGGPHIFRHTVAQRLVQRRASLKAVADLMRHRSLVSTRVYAKVDLPALSTVAMSWPGRRA